MNLSLDTDWTGIGEGNNDSAHESFSSSSGDNMLMDPSLEWRIRRGALRSFLAVYRTGGVTRAAEQLGLSQPSVSHHLRTVEAFAGRLLFTRAGRGIAPTDAGHALATCSRPSSRRCSPAGRASRAHSVSSQFIGGSLRANGATLRMNGKKQWRRGRPTSAGRLQRGC